LFTVSRIYISFHGTAKKLKLKLKPDVISSIFGLGDMLIKFFKITVIYQYWDCA